MTTCVYDGKTISADSLMSGPYLEQAPYQKITETEYGYFMFCGSAFDYEPMRDAYIEDIEGTVVTITGEAIEPATALFSNMEIMQGSQLAFIPRDGGDYCLSIVDDKGAMRKLWLSPPMAMGSGGDFAMGALMVGATSKDAVEAAIMLDSGSGGEVVSYSVGIEETDVEG